METPNRKVASGALAGALSIIIVWILGMLGLDTPAEVASAFTVILTFGTSYIVPESTKPAN